MFWAGGQAPQARVVAGGWAGGGGAAQSGGIPRGIFNLEGRQAAQRQLQSPWGEVGDGASYPGFKINRYTDSVCVYLYTL